MNLDDQALKMMLSVCATLGIVLLLAGRNPSEHRSLIAFTAWPSFAHAAVMAVRAYYGLIAHREGIGVLFLGIVGLVLIALAPARPRANGHPHPPHSADLCRGTTKRLLLVRVP
jgi:uncharacterized protein DUF6632